MKDACKPELVLFSAEKEIPLWSSWGPLDDVVMGGASLSSQKPFLSFDLLYFYAKLFHLFFFFSSSSSFFFFFTFFPF